MCFSLICEDGLVGLLLKIEPNALGGDELGDETGRDVCSLSKWLVSVGSVS